MVRGRLQKGKRWKGEIEVREEKLKGGEHRKNQLGEIKREKSALGGKGTKAEDGRRRKD